MTNAMTLQDPAETVHVAGLWIEDTLHQVAHEASTKRRLARKAQAVHTPTTHDGEAGNDRVDPPPVVDQD